MNVETINKIAEMYNNQINSSLLNDNNTFLSVIGKDYYENYISRILAYTLLKDEKTLKSLMAIYVKDNNLNLAYDDLNLSDVNIECEKNMNGRRADIFVKDNLNLITITIENKINTEEHDDQTTFYYEWVNKSYKKHTNMFFYIKPDYNTSISNCDSYKNVTYSELNSIISEDTNDMIIKDFKKHIDNKLGMINMNFEDYEITVLENYEEIENAYYQTKQKIREIQSNAISSLENCLKEEKGYVCLPYNKVKNNDLKSKIILTESPGKTDIISSHRFYKPEWYKENKFYFYVEILFKYGNRYGDIRGLIVQETVKVYSDKDVKDYCDEKFKNKSGTYYIINESDEQPEFSFVNFNSNKWEEQFLTLTKKYVPEYIEQLTKDFVEFEKECK